MVGLVSDTDHITTQAFKQEGDAILLLGVTKAELGGSEFQYAVHGLTEGRPPALDLATERKLLDAVLGTIRSGLVRSAHDLSEGGLAGALAESCISGKIGANIELSAGGLRRDVALFSESQSRIILTSAPDRAEELKAAVAAYGVPVEIIGTVGGDRLRVALDGAAALDEAVTELKTIWEDAIPCLMI
jgi:phosphoribosylformylglycinamidine synthase